MTNYYYNTPVQRLVRETVAMLKNETISPERAFAMIRFAADGSDDPLALAELARLYNNGIGCEKNRELAIDLLRKSGKVDFLIPSVPTRLDPWEEDYTMDVDEICSKMEEENRLVDAFLELEWNENAARYARYDPSNPGCNSLRKRRTANCTSRQASSSDMRTTGSTSGTDTPVPRSTWT